MNGKYVVPGMLTLIDHECSLWCFVLYIAINTEKSAIFRYSGKFGFIKQSWVCSSSLVLNEFVIRE